MMKKVYLLFMLLLNFCIVMSQNDKSVLLGKWINYYDTNNYLIFDSDSFKVVNNNFEFYLKGKRLHLFFENGLLKTEKNGIIKDNDIIACIYSFNQIGRETINDAKDKNIVGDILMFYIGPSKNYEISPTALDLE